MDNKTVDTIGTADIPPRSTQRAVEVNNIVCIEVQIKLVLLQVQCLQALNKEVPRQLMLELELLYDAMFKG